MRVRRHPALELRIHGATWPKLMCLVSSDLENVLGALEAKEIRNPESQILLVLLRTCTVLHPNAGCGGV